MNKKDRASFTLSPETEEFIKKELSRYETKRSAILPCLYRVQKENGGWVPPEAVSHLSRVMELPEAYIHEALTFYSMYNKKPVGKLHIQVCNNLSCSINGSGELIKSLCKNFNTKENELSPDGNVTITPVECLGACDQAPVALIGEEFIGPLSDHDEAYKKIKSLL